MRRQRKSASFTLTSNVLVFIRAAVHPKIKDWFRLCQPGQNKYKRPECELSCWLLRCWRALVNTRAALMVVKLAAQTERRALLGAMTNHNNFDMVGIGRARRSPPPVGAKPKRRARSDASYLAPSKLNAPMPL